MATGFQAHPGGEHAEPAAHPRADGPKAPPAVREEDTGLPTKHAGPTPVITISAPRLTTEQAAPSAATFPPRAAPETSDRSDTTHADPAPSLGPRIALGAWDSSPFRPPPPPPPPPRAPLALEPSPPAEPEPELTREEQRRIKAERKRREQEEAQATARAAAARIRSTELPGWTAAAGGADSDEVDRHGNAPDEPKPGTIRPWMICPDDAKCKLKVCFRLHPNAPRPCWFGENCHLSDDHHWMNYEHPARCEFFSPLSSRVCPNLKRILVRDERVGTDSSVYIGCKYHHVHQFQNFGDIKKKYIEKYGFDIDAPLLSEEEYKSLLGETRRALPSGADFPSLGQATSRPTAHMASPGGAFAAPRTMTTTTAAPSLPPPSPYVSVAAMPVPPPPASLADPPNPDTVRGSRQEAFTDACRAVAAHEHHDFESTLSKFGRDAGVAIPRAILAALARVYGGHTLDALTGLVAQPDGPEGDKAFVRVLGLPHRPEDHPPVVEPTAREFPDRADRERVQTLRCLARGIAVLGTDRSRQLEILDKALRLPAADSTGTRRAIRHLSRIVERLNEAGSDTSMLIQAILDNKGDIRGLEERLEAEGKFSTGGRLAEVEASAATAATTTAACLSRFPPAPRPPPGFNAPSRDPRGPYSGTPVTTIDPAETPVPPPPPPPTLGVRLGPPRVPPSGVSGPTPRDPRPRPRPCRHPAPPRSRPRFGRLLPLGPPELRGPLGPGRSRGPCGPHVH